MKSRNTAAIALPANAPERMAADGKLYSEVGAQTTLMLVSCAEVSTKQDSDLLNHQVPKRHEQAKSRTSPMQEAKWHNQQSCPRIPKGLIWWWEIKSCSPALLKLSEERDPLSSMIGSGYLHRSLPVPAMLRFCAPYPMMEYPYTPRSSLHHPERRLPCLQQRIHSHASMSEAR